MGAPLASNPEFFSVLRVDPHLLDIARHHRRLSPGDHVDRDGNADQHGGEDAGAMGWLEPLVNSSPRAASSSSEESCCSRLMRPYLITNGWGPNINLLRPAKDLPLLPCETGVFGSFPNGSTMRVPLRRNRGRLFFPGGGLRVVDFRYRIGGIALRPRPERGQKFRPVPASSAHPRVRARRGAVDGDRNPFSPGCGRRGSRS